jgi:hypothetical protein
MMRHSWSTVNTPSEMLSSMISVTFSGIGPDAGFFMLDTTGILEQRFSAWRPQVSETSTLIR